MDNPNEFSPVSESAYCVAGNVHTILLHTSPLSHVLHVFPAVPHTWADASFHQLRASGAYTIPALTAELAADASHRYLCKRWYTLRSVGVGGELQPRS